MEKRLKDLNKIHLSRAQVEGIRKSIKKHTQQRLAERIEHLVAAGDGMDDGAEIDDIGRMVSRVEERFIERVVDEMLSGCELEREKGPGPDGGEWGAEHEDEVKTEPYDFALSDKLRETHAKYERLVGEISRLRARGGPRPPNSSSGAGSTTDPHAISQLIARTLRQRVAECVRTSHENKERNPPSEPGLEKKNCPHNVERVVEIFNETTATIGATETLLQAARFNS